MPPDLPATYYLDNVRTLFRHVESVYADILDGECLQFLNDFDQLGDDSQKLLVRLLNRTNTLFRRSKLNYAEIESVPTALRELESHSFIEINPKLEAEQVLPLFNKAELIQHHHDAASLKSLKRAELDNYFKKAAQNRMLYQHHQTGYLSDTANDLLW